MKNRFQKENGFFIFAEIFNFMRNNFFLLLVVFAFFINSCGNRFEIDISDIKSQEVKIIRYEQALFEKRLDKKRIIDLQREFPLFMGDTPLDSVQVKQLQAYVKDPLLNDLYKRSKEIFSNLHKEEKELALSFRYLRKYYSKCTLPQVYTYLSGVHDDIFYQDQVLMISIDQYLGSGFEIYQQLGIPRYKQYYKTKDYLSKDVLMTMAKKFVPPIPSDAKLLEQMLYEGKLLYFIKSMMPNVCDEVLFAQTKNHLDWLVNHEVDLWRYYIENELLFKADHLVSNKFINDAPFTAVLGDDSAPKTGIWLGYRIISSFVEHTEMGLVEMLNISSAQQILQKSKYKPQ